MLARTACVHSEVYRCTEAWIFHFWNIADLLVVGAAVCRLALRDILIFDMFHRRAAYYLDHVIPASLKLHDISLAVLLFTL